jgi:TetR/AcrR family transcriptional regulator, transcriptional repressor of bet genes
MPRPCRKNPPLRAVNRNVRRGKIAQVAVDLIAREGLEAATIRRIAAELRGPTKLVTHYFADKRELLLWTYQSLSLSGARNVAAVVARDPTDLVGFLFALSPVDEKRTKLWKVYLAFWDRARRDPALVQLHRKHFKSGLARIAQIIEARHGKHHNLESVIERISAVVHGVAIQALMDGNHWSAARIRRRLTEEVHSLLDAETPYSSH